MTLAQNRQTALCNSVLASVLTRHVNTFVAEALFFSSPLEFFLGPSKAIDMDWKGVTSETCSNVKCLEWAYSVTQLLSFGCMLSAAKAHESRTMQNARQRLALDGLRSHATECTINKLSKNRFPFVICLSAECPPSHPLYMRSRSVSVLSISVSNPVSISETLSYPASLR